MNNKQTESLFQDRLPEEILKELTPEVRRQYFLWDEIMKRQIELYPWLILPVIKEVFHKEYPADKKFILLSTEYDGVATRERKGHFFRDCPEGHWRIPLESERVSSGRG